jgi:hypothetical protein
MVTDQYLQEGTLTTFTGIPFCAEVPYTYLEAKRLLRLLMAEMQADTALDALGVDRIRGGRSAITGTWDYLPFTFSDADEAFTRYPHLTLSIQRDRVVAALVLPDKLDSAMRRQLLSGGYDTFKTAIGRYIEQGRALLDQDTGALPFVEVLQRHYQTRQLSTLDAHMQFDPRTAFQGHDPIKRQEEWLRSAYAVFADKRSNLQIGIGAAFRYGASTTVSTPAFARSVVAAWCATASILDLLLGTTDRRRGGRPDRHRQTAQNALGGPAKRGRRQGGCASGARRSGS